MNAPLAPALALFSHLPPAERFHVHARAASAPLEAVASRVPSGGAVADVGCGHGLLTALLVLIGTLVAAMAGGKLGERYHHKVDRALRR